MSAYSDLGLGPHKSRKPITGTVDCCARATTGHAAALPIPAMNSRRRILDLPVMCELALVSLPVEPRKPSREPSPIIVPSLSAVLSMKFAPKRAVRPAQHPCR